MNKAGMIIAHYPAKIIFWGGICELREKPVVHFLCLVFCKTEPSSQRNI